MEPKVKIGSALKSKPQRYDSRDPWPGVPFVAPDLPDDKWATVALVIIFIGLVLGMTFDQWKWW